MAQINFDATGIKPMGINEPVPADWYTVCMTASEGKPTNSGDGHYLACEFTIMGGPYDGRKVFDNLNIGNKNPSAVEIAYRKLSAICHSVGVLQVADSAQLHNRPLMVKVGVRPAVTATESADGKAHDASNEIKGYKEVEGAQTAPAASAFPIPAAPLLGAPAPAFAAPAASAAIPPTTVGVQPAPAFVAPAPVQPAGAPVAAAPAPGAVPPWMQPKA